MQFSLKTKTNELNGTRVRNPFKSRGLFKGINPSPKVSGNADELGSATGEFVLIALPLFLPALLFFLAISQISRTEMETSFLAREAVRAFTTGGDDEAAHTRVRLLLREYPSSAFEYKVICSASPCISPGAEVELTLYKAMESGGEFRESTDLGSNFWGPEFVKSDEPRLSIASARGFVDKWQ